MVCATIFYLQARKLARKLSKKAIKKFKQVAKKVVLAAKNVAKQAKAISKEAVEQVKWALKNPDQFKQNVSQAYESIKQMELANITDDMTWGEKGKTALSNLGTLAAQYVCGHTAGTIDSVKSLFEDGKAAIDSFQYYMDPKEGANRRYELGLSIKYAITHPKETVQDIISSYKETFNDYNETLSNGNLYERQYLRSKLKTDIGIEVLTSKGSRFVVKESIKSFNHVIEGNKGKINSNNNNKDNNNKNVNERKTEDSKGIEKVNHPIRAYRNADLKKLEEKYTADPRIVVEMPYVGKGKPGTNAEGWLRDKDFYWKEIMNKYPEVLSKTNKQRIQLGFSPINDKTFREHFPQYDIKELYNDKLIHHHIGGGGQAVAVPSKLHQGTGGIHNAEKAAGVWGNDSEYAELLEKFLNK